MAAIQGSSVFVRESSQSSNRSLLIEKINKVSADSIFNYLDFEEIHSLGSTCRKWCQHLDNFLPTTNFDRQWLREFFKVCPRGHFLTQTMIGLNDLLSAYARCSLEDQTIWNGDIDAETYKLQFDRQEYRHYQFLKGTKIYITRTHLISYMENSCFCSLNPLDCYPQTFHFTIEDRTISHVALIGNYLSIFSKGLDSVPLSICMATVPATALRPKINSQNDQQFRIFDKNNQLIFHEKTEWGGRKEKLSYTFHVAGHIQNITIMDRRVIVQSQADGEPMMYVDVWTMNPVHKKTLVPMFNPHISSRKIKLSKCAFFKLACRMIRSYPLSIGRYEAEAILKKLQLEEATTDYEYARKQTKNHSTSEQHLEERPLTAEALIEEEICRKKTIEADRQYRLANKKFLDEKADLAAATYFASYRNKESEIRRQNLQNAVVTLLSSTSLSTSGSTLSSISSSTTTSILPMSSMNAATSEVHRNNKVLPEPQQNAVVTLLSNTSSSSKLMQSSISSAKKTSMRAWDSSSSKEQFHSKKCIVM